MAKHQGIIIRIGATKDQVEVHPIRKHPQHNPEVVIYDRSQMRKDGNGHLQGELRRNVVAAFEDARREHKDKRGKRRHTAVSKDKQKRERQYA